MASRLPPLNSLRIFEAAARHLSFRKAAEELNITASAVSHGMQTLEEWLGEELLVPVCAPKIKAQFANAPPEAIFAQVPLIHMTTVAADWAHWFALSGLTPPGTIGEGLHVDTVQMALEAAAEGLGLALGRLPV